MNLRNANVRARWAAALALMVAAVGAGGRPSAEPAEPVEMVPGEVLVQLRPGEAIEPVAARLDALEVEPLPYCTDIYRLRCSPGESGNELARLATRLPAVLRAAPNHIYRACALPSVTPNDPALTEQWSLRVAGSRDAWGITVGERAEEGPTPVSVALLDTGVSMTHPDLANLISPFGTDIVNGDTDPSDDHGHGTAVAGTIAASVNNGVGIASLPWEGVTIVPIKVSDNANPPATTTANLVSGISAALGTPDVQVICLSFGRPASGGPNALELAAIDSAYQSGVVVVCPAGNTRNAQTGAAAGVQFPAAYDISLAVGSVGPEGGQAAYSEEGPALDLVAPGGDDFGPKLNPAQPSQPRRLIYTTGWAPGVGDTYVRMEGTSFAAGIVSGAAAVLLAEESVDPSLTGTDRVDALVSLLTRTTFNPLGVRTNRLGNGVLNLGNALRASTVYIDLDTPESGLVTPSLAHPISGRIGVPPDQNGPRPLDISDIELIVDGVDLTANLQIENADQGTFLYQPDFDSAWGIGHHVLDIVARHPDGIRTRHLTFDPVNNIPGRTHRFRVSQRVQFRGLRMFSVPFELLPGGDTPEVLFGGGEARVYRFLTNQFRYAQYVTIGVPKEPEASFDPPDIDVEAPPAGIGYWVSLNGDIPLNLIAAPVRSPTYRVPCPAGWSMVGTPYPRGVPWSSVVIEVNGRLLSLAEAVRLRFIRPALVTWDGERYRFAFAPDGQLQPFQAYWVFCTTPLHLVFARTEGGLGTVASRGSAANLAPVGGWRLPINASVDGRITGEVVIGTARNGQNGFGNEDVAAPPSPRVVADVRSRRSEWGRANGAFLQDLWSDRRQTCRWRLEVTTGEAEAEVTLGWGEVPRGWYLTMVTPDGRLQHMTSNGSVTVRARRSAPTWVWVTAAPIR